MCFPWCFYDPILSVSIHQVDTIAVDIFKKCHVPNKKIPERKNCILSYGVLQVWSMCDTPDAIELWLCIISISHVE